MSPPPRTPITFDRTQPTWDSTSVRWNQTWLGAFIAPLSKTTSATAAAAPRTQAAS